MNIPQQSSAHRPWMGVTANFHRNAKIKMDNILSQANKIECSKYARVQGIKKKPKGKIGIEKSKGPN